MTESTDAPEYGTPADHEAEIDAAVRSLPDYQLAEVTTSLLAVLLEQCAEAAAAATENERLNRSALVAAAARAFRIIRAGMAVLAAGYELEADIHKRVMVELYVAAESVLADPSGAEAKRWLMHGMGKNIKGRVDALAPQPGGIYGPLSLASHGDARALHGLRGQEGDEPVINWGPGTTGQTVTDLRAFAIGARDFAVLLERAFSQTFGELSAVDEVLAANIPDWAPAVDWEARLERGDS